MKETELKISDWDISSRSKTCLHAEGYVYVKDVVFLSDVELREIRNINENCVFEIRNGVKKYLIDIWNNTDGLMDSDSGSIYTYYYSDANSVTYRVRKHGVIIEKVYLASKPDHATRRVCVIPEKLSGFPVVGMSVGSLDELRVNRIKNIIVPHTMREVGDNNRDLYENFDNKKNPGRTRLKIWFSTKSYNRLEIPIDINKGCL